MVAGGGRFNVGVEKLVTTMIRKQFGKQAVPLLDLSTSKGMQVGNSGVGYIPASAGLLKRIGMSRTLM